MEDYSKQNWQAGDCQPDDRDVVDSQMQMSGGEESLHTVRLIREGGSGKNEATPYWTDSDVDL